MSIQPTIDRLTTAINNSRPAWLHLDATAADNGPQVVLTATLLHPLGTVAESDEPDAIVEALTSLFDGLAAHVRMTTAKNVEHPALASASES